jgi:hypothetical protein
MPATNALASLSPGITFTPTLAFNNVESTTLGWVFDLSAPIWVSDLGYYDFSSDPNQPQSIWCCSPDTRTSGGLLDNHIVGIFNGVGTLLTSTTVPSGTAGTLVGNSRYVPIPTIELTPGQYFVEGTQQGSSGISPTDPVGFDFSAFTAMPEISYTHGVYTFGTPDVLTFASSGGYAAYIGPDFLASDEPPTTTPEPRYALVLAAGLAALWLMTKRRRTV